MQINLTTQYLSDSPLSSLSKRPPSADTVNLSLKREATNVSFTTYDVSVWWDELNV